MSFYTSQTEAEFNGGIVLRVTETVKNITSQTIRLFLISSEIIQESPQKNLHMLT